MPRGSQVLYGKVSRPMIERLIAQLAPGKQPAYRKIADGNNAFREAYMAADKSLPICSECGNNCRVLTANQDFGPEFWSHCCHATIEQDQGATP